MATYSLVDRGRRLKELRKKKRYTITALAERAGLSPNTVRAVEHGQPVHQSSLYAIINALNADQPITGSFPDKTTTSKPLLDEDVDIAWQYHNAPTALRNYVAHLLSAPNYTTFKGPSSPILTLAHELMELKGLQLDAIETLVTFYRESNRRSTGSTRSTRQTKPDTPRHTTTKHRNSA